MKPEPITDTDPLSTEPLTSKQREQLAAANALIRQRRTVKPQSMSNRPVDRNLLNDILENANRAPTHGLTQPWRFKIFTGDSRRHLAAALQQIYRKTTAKDSFRPDKFDKLGKNPLLAPVVIVVCMHRQSSESIPAIEEVEAVACAVQNMHLTASAVGLGAFWSSPALIYSKAMRNWLDLNPRDQCLGLFYLGWPKENLELPATPRTPVQTKIDWVYGNGDD